MLVEKSNLRMMSCKSGYASKMQLRQLVKLIIASHSTTTTYNSTYWSGFSLTLSVSLSLSLSPHHALVAR